VLPIFIKWKHPSQSPKRSYFCSTGRSGHANDRRASVGAAHRGVAERRAGLVLAPQPVRQPARPRLPPRTFQSAFADVERRRRRRPLHGARRHGRRQTDGIAQAALRGRRLSDLRRQPGDSIISNS
jgi:hypothetical protein